jgi:hypothetical protein
MGQSAPGVWFLLPLRELASAHISFGRHDDEPSWSSDRAIGRCFTASTACSLSPEGRDAQHAAALTTWREKWRNERRATTSGAVAAIFSGGPGERFGPIERP